jgi:dolichyl-phosphate-mannose-protein mannosyltransferase
MKITEPHPSAAGVQFRLRPWLAGALIVALALHAIVLLRWLAMLVRVPYTTLPGGELATASAVALACGAAAALAAPRRLRRAVVGIVAVTASALAGPGAVATVAVIALSAHVVGTLLLDWSARADLDDEAPASGDAALRMLVGASVWMAAIGLTLRWPIHYAPVYAIAVAASLFAAPNVTRESLAATCRWLTADDGVHARERVWIGLAVALAVLHLIVVAKPEVGYDAGTMHLQFAQLVAHDHRFAFDVGRYVWSVMPMGADDAYLAAYLLEGEQAARLANLLFGALVCAVAYGMIRRHAEREIALGSVCVLAASPLWFLETGSLFIEYAWTALLVATLASTVAFAERPNAARFAAAALCSAGALQCKAIGVIWVVPLALVLLALAARRGLLRQGRYVAVGALALALGAWPYVNAWLRTGNPVFPFLNTWFRSPLYDTAAPFNNPAYNAPLTPGTPYDVVLASGRYLEGLDGAAGIQWLLVYPLVVIGLLARPTRLRIALLSLAAGFAVLVYLQQSYLRYLFPAFVLVAIVAGIVAGDWIRTNLARAAFASAGAALLAVNVWLMPTASWTNRTLCLRCAFDDDVRHRYVADYAPLRLVADYLNRNLPDARVGFLMLNGPSPSGYVGYSRAANWHDVEAFAPFARATTADDVAAVARRFALTHAVFVDRADGDADRVLLAFRDRDTTPVARIGNYVVAAIRRDSP